VQARGRVRGVTALLGPAFVASVAYVDPGNFATNFAGGAGHGYELAWVIVMASLMAMLVQYLTAKTGLATGRSLPELCRERFGRRANVLLWLQAETVAMATDLAEFVGAAVGINLLFGVPLLPAGQIIMGGFINRRIPLLARRALTMTPSLSILALAVNPSQVLVWSQIILSFGIPFALIPLLLITRDPAAMTGMPNRRLTSTLMLLVTVVITGLNLDLLYGAATSRL